MLIKNYITIIIIQNYITITCVLHGWLHRQVVICEEVTEYRAAALCPARLLAGGSKVTYR